MSRENTLSLTLMVIIMAILAIFIGYLLGNWLIQMVTGDSTDSHQVAEDKIVENETIEDKENESNEEATNNNITNNGENLDPKSEIDNQIQGDVFVIQVGAFKNFNNASALKSELEKEGFEVIITDESPYKVQLGPTTDRAKAEKTEEKVESMGYNAFITH